MKDLSEGSVLRPLGLNHQCGEIGRSGFRLTPTENAGTTKTIRHVVELTHHPVDHVDGSRQYYYIIMVARIVELSRTYGIVQ